MTIAEILENIVKELEFYRLRHWSVFYYSLISIALIVIAQKWIPVSKPIYLRIVSTACLICIGVVYFFCSREYVNRIYYLRHKRENILKTIGYTEVFPLPERKIRPSKFYRCTVSFFTIAAIVIVWLCKAGSS